MEEIFNFIGRAICHQDPARSLFFENRQMMVCARCASLYIAFAMTVLFLQSIKEDMQSGSTHKIRMSVLLLLPISVDMLTVSLGFRETSNNIRVFSGICAGIFFGIVLVRIRYHERKQPLNAIASHGKPFVFSLAVLLSFIVISAAFRIGWLYLPFQIITSFSIVFVLWSLFRAGLERVFNEKFPIKSVSFALTACFIFAASTINSLLS